MTKPISSLDDFKRALTVGSRWEGRSAAKLPDPENPAVLIPTVSEWFRKTVVHLQSNRVAFSLEDTPDAIAAGMKNPRRNGGWLELPKANICSFRDGAIRITYTDEHHWREYRLLAQPNEGGNQ